MSFTESNLSPGGFGPGDTEWIHLIIGEWQIIADTLLYGSPLTMWWLMGAGRIAFLDRRRPAGFQQ